jgi:hypothetical protein
MKQYSNVKRQYNLTFKGIDAETAQYSKSFKNTTQHNNNKRFRFNLNGNFNHVQLGNNAKVSIESVFVPSNNLNHDNYPTIIRLRETMDDIYDTELGLNNHPIIIYTKIVDTIYETVSSKQTKCFKISRDFLNKGYIEFDLYVEDPTLNHDIEFVVNNFMVSLVIFEEDFEETKDLINAPQVVNNPPQKLLNNFYPNYNNK